MAILDLSNLGRFDLDASKKTQYTDQSSISYQTTNTTTFAPTVNKTFDFQYNIASEGSTISTKKEMAVKQTPQTSPQITPQVIQIPTSTQGLTTEKNEASSSSIFDYLLLGGVVLGAVLIVPEVIKTKKLKK